MIILRIKQELLSPIVEAMRRAIELRKYIQVLTMSVSHLHKCAPVSLGGSGTLRAGSAAALHLNN